MKMGSSPDVSKPDDDGLREEYDFHALRGVVRGKYAARYNEQLRVVRLADDIASAFLDDAAVNHALREYLRDHAPTASGP